MKDPATNPTASLARVLVDQVSLLSHPSSVFLNSSKKYSCTHSISSNKTVEDMGIGSLQVDRKLVKQTVMTSVYGVTYIGARQQITKRLQEKGLITDDKLLYDVSCYATRVSDLLVIFGVLWCICDLRLTPLGRERHDVTSEFLMKVTLDALGQMFQSARGIMAWLGDCAKVHSHSQLFSYMSDSICFSHVKVLDIDIQFLTLEAQHFSVVEAFNN
jgi:DNA-directed RNA polymerase